MQNKTLNQNFGTWQDLFDYLVSYNLTTRHALAVAARCSEETVRRWQCFDQVPATEHLQAMQGHASLLPLTIKQALRDHYDQTTIFASSVRTGCDQTTLDADGDGIVDSKDAANLAVCSIRKASSAIDDLLKSTDLTAVDRSRVDFELLEAISKLNSARQALYAADTGPRMRAG